jgi:hypothetical protein
MRPSVIPSTITPCWTTGWQWCAPKSVLKCPRQSRDLRLRQAKFIVESASHDPVRPIAHQICDRRGHRARALAVTTDTQAANEHNNRHAQRVNQRTSMQVRIFRRRYSSHRRRWPTSRQRRACSERDIVSVGSVERIDRRDAIAGHGPRETRPEFDDLVGEGRSQVEWSKAGAVDDESGWTALSVSVVSSRSCCSAARLATSGRTTSSSGVGDGGSVAPAAAR